MGERERFEAAIAAKPDDATARGAFADWLDENTTETDLAAAYRRLPWHRSGLDALAGRKVEGLLRGGDELVFVLGPDDVVIVLARADCCSETWFYALKGVSALIGHTVTGFFEPDVSWVDGNDGLGRQESESIYGVGVLTTGGAFTVVYRNSSNGYYGGWLESSRATSSRDGLERVTEDWVHPPASEEVPHDRD